MEKQKKQKTKPYQTPISLKRNLIKLEKDGYKDNIYYITFTYTATVPFKANFYINAYQVLDQTASLLKEEQDSSFVPSEHFATKTCSAICKPGNDIEFTENNVYVDMNYFNFNRIYDCQYYDLVVEMIGIVEEGTSNCALATMCKFVPEAKGEKLAYKVKAEQQRLKFKGFWFDMQDVYGFSTDSNRLVTIKDLVMSAKSVVAINGILSFCHANILMPVNSAL